MKAKLLIALLLSGGLCNAQLQNGSVAPDFTLTDLNGVTHHLYDYLDQGKTVFIDCFAAHCPTCWGYHNQHHIENLYLNHGPMGALSNDVIVIAVEQDPNNGLNELNGISGSTQGDWLDGTTHPVINPEGADRTAFISDYAVNFYPLVYAICPDRTISNTGTISDVLLFEHAVQCGGLVGQNELSSQHEIEFQYSSVNNTITLSNGDPKATLTIFDITGKVLQSGRIGNESKQIPVLSSTVGIYFCRIENPNGISSTFRFLKSE